MNILILEKILKERWKNIACYDIRKQARIVTRLYLNYSKNYPSFTKICKFLKKYKMHYEKNI